MAKSSILDIVPKIIADTVGKLLFRDGVLTVVGPSTGPSYDPTPGEPVNHPCLALATDFGNYARANGLVAGEDRKILIIAASIPGIEPRDGNTVTIEGEAFVLVSQGGSAPAVRRDPATATWTCRGRG